MRATSNFFPTLVVSATTTQRPGRGSSSEVQATEWRWSQGATRTDVIERPPDRGREGDTEPSSDEKAP